jgi:hypothetical protein
VALESSDNPKTGNESAPADSFRDTLQRYSTESQDDYDKAVLSLSGGALGISFAFLKDFVGSREVPHPWLLAVAWSCWGFSLLSVLWSFYSARIAFDRAIEKWDAKVRDPKELGGNPNAVTKALNFLSGVLFLLGVISMTVFASFSLGTRLPNDSQGQAHRQETIIQTIQESEPGHKESRKACTSSTHHP